LAAAGLLSLAAALMPFGAAAQAPSPGPSATPASTATPPEALTVVTTYPSIVVDPGAAAIFPVEVTAPEPVRVDLAVDGVPEGWEAAFRGGDSIVSSVFAGAEPPFLELHVDVPEEAEPGTVTMTLSASGADQAVELPVDLVVADTGGGSVTLSTDFPFLRGDTESPFSFDLDLANETSRALTFSLEGAGPDGWDVSVRPATEEQAASIQVAPNDEEGVQVTVDPLPNEQAGQYPIAVRASGDGYTAETELVVEITGSYALALDAPDGRLNASGTAGSQIDYPVVVINEGTAPLQGVQLSGTPPRGWEVAFEPETIELIPPGEVAQAAARITPDANAVAGDYDVTLQASSEQAEDSIAVRTTVETSTLWGFVGVGIILVVLVGLFLVFRTFGRR